MRLKPESRAYVDDEGRLVLPLPSVFLRGFGYPFPTCSGYLWAQGVIQYP